MTKWPDEKLEAEMRQRAVEANKPGNPHAALALDSLTLLARVRALEAVHGQLLGACKGLMASMVDYKFEHWAASVEDNCAIARAAIKAASALRKE